jgi:arsenite methyltransferase
MADTEALAQGYTRVNDTQRNAGAFLLDRLGIGPGMRVLDIGCGPGDITSHLAELVGDSGSVVGIDPSAERIGIAQAKAKPNLSFHVGKAEDLSAFPSDSFDIIFVNSTLHWVQDQGLALRECGRVLKSGGRVGISGGSGDFLSAQEKIKAEVLSREPYRNYPEDSPPKFLKRRELELLLDNAGLLEKQIVVNTIVKSADSAEAMIDWLDTSSSGKTYGGIPLNLRPKAREEMKVEWNKIASEKGIQMVLELLVTVASKS